MRVLDVAPVLLLTVGLLTPALLPAQAETQTKPESISAQLSEYQAGATTVFRTAGHAKSNGVGVHLAVPTNWLGREGIRPHVLQLFSGSTADGRIMECTISIFPLPAELSGFTSDEIVPYLFDPSLASSYLPEGAALIMAQSTHYDGEPGLLMGYSMETSRAGINLSLITLRHWFLYGRSTVDVQITLLLTTTPGSMPPTENDVRSFTLLAFMIGNSIVIDDKWR